MVTSLAPGPGIVRQSIMVGEHVVGNSSSIHSTQKAEGTQEGSGARDVFERHITRDHFLWPPPLIESASPPSNANKLSLSRDCSSVVQSLTIQLPLGDQSTSWGTWAFRGRWLKVPGLDWTEVREKQILLLPLMQYPRPRWGGLFVFPEEEDVQEQEFCCIYLVLLSWQASWWGP